MLKYGWKKDRGMMVVMVGVMGVAFGVAQNSLLKTNGVVLAETTSLSLEERVAALEKRVTVLERRTATTAKKTGVKKTSYVSLSSGTATGVDWTTVSGTEFWFNQELYGGVTEISWEGLAVIQDGNGIGVVRLYDITNSRAVDFSEVKVSGEGKISFYSPVIAIWRGQNQYRVEVKSSTGYPVSISQARLKIVSQ